MNNENKMHNQIIASFLTIVLLVSGTFTWQSFSQHATNEIIYQIDTPGGRLHDYFNGTNKDVFVENYATGDSAPDVYARIKLYEYFEYGAGAGTSSITDPTVVRGDILNESAPVINDVKTWDIYDFVTDSEPGVESIRTYRTLEIGGGGVYLPTYNLDNESLEVETNGTFTGTNGDGRENKESRYDDYVSFQLGQAYDEDKEITTEADAHIVAETAIATAISMAQWESLDEEFKSGDFWVFDTTGWAYYAKPIPSSTASGLLLDSVTTVSNPQEEWYYAIEVAAQMATFGDWGDKAVEGVSTGTGMYGELTQSAESLLHHISSFDSYLSETNVIPESELEVEPEPEDQEDIYAILELDTRYNYAALATDDLREMYKQIALGIYNMEEVIYITAEGYSKDVTNNLLLTILSDFPEIIWSQFGFYSYTDKLVLVYPVTEEEASHMQDEIDQMENEYLKTLTNTMTDYEKIVHTFEYVCDNVVYLEENDHQTIYGAMVNGEAVCAGYARMFQYLLMNQGIECAYVTGTAYINSSAVNHGWNLVKLDGEYYYVDPTWGDDYGVDGRYVYNYLMQSYTNMEDTHVPEDIHAVPLSEFGTKYIYTTYNSIIFDAYDQDAVKTAWSNMHKGGMRQFDLQFTNDSAYVAAYTDLCVNQEVLALIQEVSSEPFTSVSPFIVNKWRTLTFFPINSMS